MFGVCLLFNSDCTNGKHALDPLPSVYLRISSQKRKHFGLWYENNLLQDMKFLKPDSFVFSSFMAWEGVYMKAVSSNGNTIYWAKHYKLRGYKIKTISLDPFIRISVLPENAKTRKKNIISGVINLVFIFVWLFGVECLFLWYFGLHLLYQISIGCFLFNRLQTVERLMKPLKETF